MPIYHLDIRERTEGSSDTEGLEFASLNDARLAAIEGIRGFLAETLKDGVIDLEGHVEITDPDGATLLIVPYADAVEIKLPETDWVR